MQRALLQVGTLAAFKAVHVKMWRSANPHHATLENWRWGRDPILLTATGGFFLLVRDDSHLSPIRGSSTLTSGGQSSSFIRTTAGGDQLARVQPVSPRRRTSHGGSLLV